jgi:hypothetical protein
VVFSSTILERTATRVTIEASQWDGPGFDQLGTVFQQAYRRHFAVITVDMAAVTSVDQSALDLFSSWQDLALRSGFHVLFVHAHDPVYGMLRGAGLDCLPTV